MPLCKMKSSHHQLLHPLTTAPSLAHSLTPPQPHLLPPLLSAGSPPSGLPIPAAVLIDEVRSRLLVIADGLWEGHPEATHGPQPLFQFCDLHGGGKKLGMTQTCF